MIAAPLTIRTKLAIWLFVGIGMLMFIGANAHLVYVASISQPDCIEHLREVAAGGEFRAAKSSCTPARQIPKPPAEAHLR